MSAVPTPSRMRQGAAAVSFWLARIVEVAMCAAIAGVAVMVFAQVVFRYALRSPLSFSEEIARHLTVWAALLGAALVFRSGTHFAIRYVVDHLPKRVGRVIAVLGQALVLGFLLFFFTVGVMFVPTGLAQESPGARINLGLIYAAVPVSAAIMLVFALTAAIAKETRPLPFDSEDA